MIKQRNHNKFSTENPAKNFFIKENYAWLLIVSLIAVLLGTVTAGEAAHHLASEPRIISITGNDQMKFDITEIEVKAGENNIDLPTARDYSKSRSQYVSDGGGTPPPGSEPIEPFPEAKPSEE